MGVSEKATGLRVFTDQPTKIGADAVTRAVLTECVHVPGEWWRGYRWADFVDAAREVVARPWRRRCLNLGGWWFGHLMMWDRETGFAARPGREQLIDFWRTGRLPGLEAEAERLSELGEAIRACYTHVDLIYLDVETGASAWDAPWFFDAIRASTGAINRFPKHLRPALRADELPAWNSPTWRELVEWSGRISRTLVARELWRGLALAGLVHPERRKHGGPVVVNYGYFRTHARLPVFDHNGWPAGGMPLDQEAGAPVCYLDARDEAGRPFIRRYPRGDEAARVDAEPEWCALVDNVNAIRSAAACGYCVPVLAAEWWYRDAWRARLTRELIGHAVRSGVDTFYLWNPGPDVQGTTTFEVERSAADMFAEAEPWYQPASGKVLPAIDYSAERIETADLVTERAAVLGEAAATAAA